MSKEMKEVTSRIISHKRRKNKMTIRIGIALIIVIQSTHLLRITS